MFFCTPPTPRFSFCAARMTSARWRSAFVAGLFAFHPTHVESVAWVSERKDVLSAFFWMLTLLAYVRYAERPILAKYLLLAACLTLGLMAKPMLVTLPLVLLLLDYWPLHRLSPLSPPGRGVGGEGSSLDHLRGLLIEKLPLLAIAAFFSCIALFAQKREGALRSFEELSLAVRLENVPVAYVRYLGMILWPQHLAVFYPFPSSGFPIWQWTGASSP